MKILQIILLKAKYHSYQILAEFTGEDLAGTTYEQLIPWFLPAENRKSFPCNYRRFCNHRRRNWYCTHCANFRADDNRVAQENGIPPMLVKMKMIIWFLW
jgi:isoleucyl-tRNA synthetase